MSGGLETNSWEALQDQLFEDPRLTLGAPEPNINHWGPVWSVLCSAQPKGGGAQSLPQLPLDPPLQRTSQNWLKAVLKKIEKEQKIEPVLSQIIIVTHHLYLRQTGPAYEVCLVLG